MEKKLILDSLEKLSQEIESKFNTVVLRRMYAHKSSGIFRTIYPIDNKSLSGKENNVFGPSFPRLKSFNDNNANYVCLVLIPVNEHGIVIKSNLSTSTDTFKTVTDFCANDLGLQVYDGGQIKMSYIVPEGMETENIYSSKDYPITPEIYSKLGSVSYRRILYYL
ncbi:hypothetical protein [Rufibacter ruber]|uniref:hypothetical protein n=1 Tax=Rufibacter ruber TaxID=1783499 RepID=UPI00082AF991|nr:hypothetical protein [Rufibacter ruber]